MENPRLLLAKFLDDRLATLPGGLGAFTDRLCILEDREAEVYRKFIYAVRVGRKAIPEGETEEHWASALRLVKGSPERKEFARLVTAGRAWGKTNGREFIAALESERDSLRREIAALKARVAQRDEDIRRLSDRMAFLESEELKG